MVVVGGVVVNPTYVDTVPVHSTPQTHIANGMHWWPNPLLDEDEVPAWAWLVGPVSETPQ